MKKSVNNIIFYTNTIDIRSGGPSGYIANLREGLGTENNSVCFITPSEKYYRFAYIFSKFVTKIIFLSKYRRIIRKRLFSSLLHLHLGFLLHKYSFKTIICHSVWDVPFVRDYIKKNEPDALLMLMSHTPEPPSSEVWTTMKPKEKQIWPWEKLQALEYEAFESADILIFPSKEAMEPYLSSLDYFETLIQNKAVYFIPTGVTAIPLLQSTDELRKTYHIQTPYVISYIGRHNKIKGYDILQAIARDILEDRKDVTFLIAGKPSTAFPPLQHPRWIEIGYEHPSKILSVSDLFILPNRQTYFDLVLLEVLSTGVPILASNTGGNKSVYRQTNAIKLFSTPEECKSYIYEFLSLPTSKKAEIRKKGIDAYTKYYTPPYFVRNYLSLIQQILDIHQKI